MGVAQGLSYDLQFTPKEEGDTIIQHEGFNVYMDAKKYDLSQRNGTGLSGWITRKRICFCQSQRNLNVWLRRVFFYHLIKFVFQITQAMALTV